MGVKTNKKIIMGFKIGDKVVYVKKGSTENRVTPPEIGETCIVSSFNIDGIGIQVEGYEVNIKTGNNQYFAYWCFRKVEPKKATNKATLQLLREFKESEIIKEVDVIEHPEPINC